MRIIPLLACLAALAPAPAGAQGLTRDSLAALVTVGDAAWQRGEHDVAAAAYDLVVRADSSFSARALFRVGIVHSWNDRLDQAIACQRLYVRLEPDDLDGRLALARTYGWASRFAEAKAQYDAVTARDAGNLDARRGRARLLAWQGDLGQAERAWHAILAERSDDAESWEGLGQTLRWEGRSLAAEEALARAATLDPTNVEVRDALAVVRADVRPTATVALVGATDSEENTMLQLELRGAVVTRGELRLGTTVRTKSVSGAAPGAAAIPGAHATLDWQPRGTGWTVRAEAGAVSYPAGVGAASAQGRGSLRAMGRLGARVTLGAGVGREPFDDVLSMAERALMFGVADVDVGVTVHPRLSLGLAVSRGEVGGHGVRDARTTALGAARWTVTRSLRAALTHREIAWDEPAYGIFFAPQRFAISEASVRWTRVEELGLVADAELGLGAQAIRFESDPVTRSLASRAAVRLGWRPRPGREVVAALVVANVAGAGTITAGEYQYGALTLTGRWTF